MTQKIIALDLVELIYSTRSKDIIRDQFNYVVLGQGDDYFYLTTVSGCPEYNKIIEYDDHIVITNRIDLFNTRNIIHILDDSNLEKKLYIDYLDKKREITVLKLINCVYMNNKIIEINGLFNFKIIKVGDDLINLSSYTPPNLVI